MKLRKPLAVLLSFSMMFPPQVARSQEIAAPGSLYLDESQVGEPVFSSAPQRLDIASSGALWRPYIELGGVFGDSGANFFSNTSNGFTNAFIPISQSYESLLFLDLRGIYGNEGDNQGSFGVGFRKFLQNDMILGTYGFYDYYESMYGNQYHAGTFGIELLDLNWDIRLNGTVPTDEVNVIECGLRVVDDNLTILNRSEAGYYGTNGEFGFLTFANDTRSIEWRNYIGAYAYDRSGSEFEGLYGPRARTELRLFDLPWLGNGSRVVLAGQYQYDSVRGSQAAGM